MLNGENVGSDIVLTIHLGTLCPSKAIRPANADQGTQGWDAQLGAFALGSRLTLR